MSTRENIRLIARAYLIIVINDNADRIVIPTVSLKHLQFVCRHIKIYPAGDRFFIIQPEIRM